MVAIPRGEIGHCAVSHVAVENKTGSGTVLTLCLVMEELTVLH